MPLSATEEAYTAAGTPLATIFPYTQLRMLRPGIATAVVEDGKLVVYHCMDNSRLVTHSIHLVGAFIKVQSINLMVHYNIIHNDRIIL